MNETYTVMLQDAQFSTDSNSVRGDFLFALLINNEVQAQVELSVESSSGGTNGLVTLAQRALVAALNGWATAAGNSI